MPGEGDALLLGLLGLLLGGVILGLLSPAVFYRRVGRGASVEESLRLSYRLSMVAVALTVVPIALIVVGVFASFGLPGLLAVLGFFAALYLLSPFFLTFGSVPADRAGYEWLQSEVNRLAEEAGYDKPVRVYVRSDQLPNAYAVSNALRRAIVVNRGLLDVLDKREIRAVLAHEFGHIVHRDSSYALAAGFAPNIAYLIGMLILFAGLSLVAGAANYSRYSRPDSPGASASFIAGLTGLLIVLIGSLIVLATIVANLSILAFSRLREHYADVYSAGLTRDTSLISALEKIESAIAGARQQGPRPPSLRNMLYIVPALRGDVFSTHPSLEKRRMVILAYLDQIGHSRGTDRF